MWTFRCRNCGFQQTHLGWPFGNHGEFPVCQRCNGATYRPSLEDDLLDMDERRDEPDCYGSAWARAVVLRREEEAARRGIGDIPDSERGDR